VKSWTQVRRKIAKDKPQVRNRHLPDRVQPIRGTNKHRHLQRQIKGAVERFEHAISCLLGDFGKIGPGDRLKEYSGGGGRAG